MYVKYLSINFIFVLTSTDFGWVNFSLFQQHQKRLIDTDSANYRYTDLLWNDTVIYNRSQTLYNVRSQCWLLPTFPIKG